MTVTGAHASPNNDLAGTIAAWHTRPAQLPPGSPANAITIDVEDYFQVEAFFGVIDRGTWDQFDCRVERNVDQILAMLAETKTRATFFTLAWIAERYPGIVRKIVANGHELASHGTDHRRADGQNYAEFLADVARAKHMLEDLGGAEVKGYRAPSFSVLEGNLWALDALAVGRLSLFTVPASAPSITTITGIPQAPRFEQ